MEEEIELNVRLLDGSTSSFTVVKDMLVGDFKSVAEDVVGIPPARQRLIFRGRPLDDAQTLGHYITESGMTISLAEIPEEMERGPGTAPNTSGAGPPPQPQQPQPPQQTQHGVHQFPGGIMFHYQTGGSGPMLAGPFPPGGPGNMGSLIQNLLQGLNTNFPPPPQANAQGPTRPPAPPQPQPNASQQSPQQQPTSPPTTESTQPAQAGQPTTQQSPSTGTAPPAPPGESHPVQPPFAPPSASPRPNPTSPTRPPDPLAGNPFAGLVQDLLRGPPQPQQPPGLGTSGNAPSGATRPPLFPANFLQEILRPPQQGSHAGASATAAPTEPAGAGAARGGGTEITGGAGGGGGPGGSWGTEELQQAVRAVRELPPQSRTAVARLLRATANAVDGAAAAAAAPGVGETRGRSPERRSAPPASETEALDEEEEEVWEDAGGEAGGESEEPQTFGGMSGGGMSGSGVGVGGPAGGLPVGGLGGLLSSLMTNLATPPQGTGTGADGGMASAGADGGENPVLSMSEEVQRRYERWTSDQRAFGAAVMHRARQGNQSSAYASGDPRGGSNPVTVPAPEQLLPLRCFRTASATGILQGTDPSADLPELRADYVAWTLKELAEACRNNPDLAAEPDRFPGIRAVLDMLRAD
uniref:Ubiquitin-like domain-containing protein n=1 Tax=Chromera velia CCMP2878 TaxID=1169474 RepID=A0A0G4GZ95_9ALVE|eukprot:Cvel_5425.t1-p1 / transcript=Cvel_5425.t1 / gene=Cvel_5425 / organism=Chromera_velia_CCMP2878 / gene_product=Large proline-rich protein bag6-B, putative / transcript_product=Large proline-rich protein bag6-B, putative / location=Cvel_scaffold252:86049-91351(-) / protein_length=638 / sequence_SO=supercontig / SO=protein_coding / is_pseudo=false